MILKGSELKPGMIVKGMQRSAHMKRAIVRYTQSHADRWVFFPPTPIYLWERPEDSRLAYRKSVVHPHMLYKVVFR